MKQFFPIIALTFLTALSLHSQNIVKHASPGFDSLRTGIPHGKIDTIFISLKRLAISEEL